MLILLKDLTDNVIPYTTEEKGILIGFIIYSSIAMLMSFLLIFAIVKQRAIPFDTQFILHICVADALFCIIVLTFHVINLIGGGWVTGATGCLGSSMGVLNTLGLSVLTILALTVHRYLIVIRRYHLSQNQIYLVIGGIWAFLAVIATVYLSSVDYGVGIALQPSKYYCMVNFTASNPGAVLLSGLILFVLVFICLFMIYAYSAIIKVFKNSLAKKRQKDQSLANLSQQLLIEKAIAFSGAFAICWLPYIIKVVIEMATKESVSYEVDCICDLAGCSNSLLNVIVLIKYDARVKQNVFELLDIVTAVRSIRKANIHLENLSPPCRNSITVPATVTAVLELPLGGDEVDTRLIVNT